MGTIQKGDVFGEMGVLEAVDSATTITAEDSVILRILNQFYDDGETRTSGDPSSFTVALPFGNLVNVYVNWMDVWIRYFFKTIEEGNHDHHDPRKSS